MRILIVEDEQLLRENLAQYLQSKGYVTQSAKDGDEGLFYGTEYEFDAAIIDLGLPKLTGIELIQALRKSEKSYPIIILTAQGQWQDKVSGLEAGADDYITKPYHNEELAARLNAVIRRYGGWSQALLQAGPIELNSTTQEVKVSNSPIELTAFEYKVLQYLMLNPGKVVSKMELTEHIYQQDFDRDSNVIEVFVGRLRKKIDPSNEFKFIETLRGRGYRFQAATSD